MKIKILEIKDSASALVLTLEQRRKLSDLFKVENIRMPISRRSIQIKRLNFAFSRMSEESKKKLENILNIVELRVGHSKCIQVNFWIELTPDLCWLYGALIGDGNIIKACRFYNANDEIIKEINRVTLEHFKVEMKKEPNRPIDYFLPKPVLSILRTFFGSKGRCYEARIPVLIFSLPIEFQSSFIRGMFDTDGSIAKGHPPNYTSVSEGLINDLQLLLKSKFDINSWIWHSERHAYKIYLGVKNRIENFLDYLKFYEMINFTHPKKKLILEMNIKTRTLYGVLELVKSGFEFSDQIKEVLHKDWSTIIDHLNHLENLGLIEKEPVKAYNLIEHKWKSIY